MTFDERVRALEPLGFTARQTRFLVTLALHSGYCQRRHYQTFAGVQYGKAVRDFLDGMVARGLVSRFTYRRDRGHLYHLHASSIYRALEQDDNRNRRHASPALIARKLMLLDYVLSVRGGEWLATEQDKVALFSTRFNVPLSDLPQRTYIGTTAPGQGATTRFFIQKLPIHIADDSPVQFTYLVMDVSGCGFRRFLQDHARLLHHLGAWSVVAVCPCHINGMAACQMVFREFIAGQLSRPFIDASELPWYFATRQKVEQGEFGSVSVSEINRFRDARRHYVGAAVEDLYGEWLRRGDVALERSRIGERVAIKPSSGHLLTALLPGRYEQFGSIAGVS